MAVTLRIGNLPWAMSADDLYSLFEGHGRVLHAQVIMDRDRGRSRGYGFVEMADETEARTATVALQRRLYQGRALTIVQTRRNPGET